MISARLFLFIILIWSNFPFKDIWSVLVSYSGNLKLFQWLSRKQMKTSEIGMFWFQPDQTLTAQTKENDPRQGT